MSTQNVYFTNPTVVNNIQTSISTLQSTTANIVGLTHNIVKGPDFGYFAFTGTIMPETWTYGGGKDRSGNKFAVGIAPQNSSWAMQSYRKAQSHNLGIEQLGGQWQHVVDEKYIYCIVKGTLMETTDWKDQSPNSLYWFYRQLFGHLGVFDLKDGTTKCFIAKFDRWTLQPVAASPPLEMISANKFEGINPTPVYTQAGRWKSARGPCFLSDDHIFFTTGWGVEDHASIFKMNKSDLSVVWVWEPEQVLYPQNLPGDAPSYGPSAQLQNVMHVPAKGSRNFDMIISGNNNAMYYIVYGGGFWRANTFGPPNTYNGVTPITTQYDDPIYDFLKIQPGYMQGDGRAWGIQDNGSSCFQKWVFTCSPKRLKAGDTLPTECFRPNASEVYTYNMLHSTGSNLTTFVNDTYSNNLGETYLDTDGNPHNGHWLFYNYTGTVYGDPAVDGVPALIYANGICFVDFMDTYNSTNVNINGNKFNKDGVYKAYYMKNMEGAPINTFANYAGLWSVDTPQATGGARMSFVVDMNNPLMVPGSVLLGQPIVKKFKSAAIDTLVLDEYDADSLNYQGGGIYGSFCWDDELDCMYMGVSNGSRAPLDDLIAVTNFPTVDNGSEPCGRNFDIFYNVYYGLKDYNRADESSKVAKRTAAIDLKSNAETREDRKLLCPRSPRSNRACFGGIVSLDVATGKLHWINRGIAYENFDWDTFFLNVPFRFYFDGGWNADNFGCMLVKNAGSAPYPVRSQKTWPNPGAAVVPAPGIKTTNNRMLISQTKTKVFFLDPDATSRTTLQATRQGDDTFYINGVNAISTDSRPNYVTPKGPELNEYFYPNTATSIFIWNGAPVSDGYRSVHTIGGFAYYCLWSPYGAAADDPDCIVPCYSPINDTWVDILPQTKALCVYNITTEGQQDLYGPQGTGAVVQLERIIPVAPDLGAYSERGGTSLYGNCALTTHSGRGCILGYNIYTGQEVFREFTRNTVYSPPIVVNDVMYPSFARQLLIPNTLNQIQGDPNYVQYPYNINANNGSFSLDMFTCGGK